MDKTVLVKEAGFNKFSPVPSRPTNGHKPSEIAQIYLNTDQSLRQRLKDAIDNNSPSANKIENDLAEFYKSVGNKYGLIISSKDEFEKLMADLSKSDDIIDKAKDQIRDYNSKVRNKQNNEYQDDSFLENEASNLDAIFSAPLKVPEKKFTAAAVNSRLNRNSFKNQTEIESQKSDDQISSNVSQDQEQKDSDNEVY